MNKITLIISFIFLNVYMYADGIDNVSIFLNGKYLTSTSLLNDDELDVLLKENDTITFEHFTDWNNLTNAFITINNIEDNIIDTIYNYNRGKKTFNYIVNKENINKILIFYLEYGVYKPWHFLTIIPYDNSLITNIKNQEYLKYSGKVDCNNEISDNLSERICSNLNFQKNDSVLIFLNYKIEKNLFCNQKLYMEYIKEKIIWQQNREFECLNNTHNNDESSISSLIDFMNCLNIYTIDRIKYLLKKD